MRVPLIVGICGLKRAGKDALFEALSGKYPGELWRYAWADPVKRATMLVAGLGLAEVEGQEGVDREAPREDLGGKSIRDVLRDVGMLGRACNPDRWVTATREKWEDDLRWAIQSKVHRPSLILVSGTRFPNEAAACDETWWVDRGGEPDDHPAATSLRAEDCTRVVPNHGTLADLLWEGQVATIAALNAREGRFRALGRSYGGQVVS